MDCGVAAAAERHKIGPGVLTAPGAPADAMGLEAAMGAAQLTGTSVARENALGDGLVQLAVG